MSDRIDLHSNINSNNTIDFADYYDLAFDVLESISNDIIWLCGKDALCNLVVFKKEAANYLNNVFSNDGIHILKSTEYINPIQNFIANFIRYISERVDAASSDGTSTAIYIATNVMMNVLNDIDNIRRKYDKDDIDDVSLIMKEINQYKKRFISTFTIIRNELKNYRITVDDLSIEDKKKFIYNLSYISSKGNDKLSSYMVELFSNIPNILFKYVSYTKAVGETEEDFTITKIDHDFAITITPSNNTEYNSKLGTELLFEECNLLVIPTLNSVNTLAIVEYIKKYKIVSTLPLVLIVNGGDDSSIVKLEREIAYIYTDVILCKRMSYLPSFMDNPLELNILQVISGNDIIKPITVDDIEKSMIYNVKCRIYNKMLFVYNLFDCSESYPLHPSYVKEDNNDYNKLRYELEENISRIESMHDNYSHKDDLNEFIRLYTNLTCSKLSKLTIGGLAIDHLANINVTNDVLGVVSIALQHGFIIDAIPRLVKLFQKYDSENEELINDLIRFCKLNYSNNLYDIFDPNSTLFEDKFKFINQDLFVWNTLDLDNHIPITQSYKSLDELLLRLIESIPRLLSIDKIIVKDGITTNKNGE